MPDAQSLHALLERSSCPLDVFSLSETARMWDDARHMAFLQTPHLASITDLELHVDMTDKIVEFLTYDDGAQQQLPNLTYLALRDRRGEHISNDKLAAMLSSRAPASNSTADSSPALLRVADMQLRLAGHAYPQLCRDSLELRLELLNCFCK